MFDSEELLESSILSIRKNVDYVVVVYQLISNWGNPANPKLTELLNDLERRGLVDELISYHPKDFSTEGIG